MENMVHLKINNMPVEVKAGTTILRAAYKQGIDIPTLCYLKEINEIGACRICVVEVKGMQNLVTSCVAPVSEGMEVFTNTPRVRAAHKTNLELILSAHKKSCLSCIRSGDCELQTLSRRYGISDENRFKGEEPEYEFDASAVHLTRDNAKCILCRRCVAACHAIQGIGCIGASGRGFDTHISCAFEAPLEESPCISCGQCVVACPTGALSERDCSAKVWNAISNPEKHVIVQTAPSVRATLGEAFGMPIGTDVEGKMVAALRRIGFDKVYDTDLAADLTIMEEATEFLNRYKNGETLPMITSCCPGWVKYCEMHHPEFIPNLSSCKSPQQMFGAISKTYYAEKMGLAPEDIFTVSIMPCTAKKFEQFREDQNAAGLPDIDGVLTTREFARMIDRVGLSFPALPNETFDPALGESSGAGVIFGATGGVMEAALRTATEVLTGDSFEKLDFSAVRGTQGIKEATYQLGEVELRVCVISGLENADTVLNAIKNGDVHYDFIEIMACPGGCINGGGQPTQPSNVQNFVDLKSLRAQALYNNDKMKTIRKSHENPLIKKIYEEFLGEPNGHKSHELLHTSYMQRVSKY